MKPEIIVMNGLAKPLCLVGILLCTACDAQDIKQNYVQEQYRNIPKGPVKADTLRRGMPVLKPDTTQQKKMPVAKPPADIQYK
jgi:hypothetical protein